MRVDLAAEHLRVHDAKTDAGVRAVQLTPDTVADLRRYLDMTAERPASAPLLTEEVVSRAAQPARLCSSETGTLRLRGRTAQSHG